MSTQEKMYGKFSEYELEVLKIPIELRGNCLDQYVSYANCFHKNKILDFLRGNSCQDFQMKFNHCRSLEKLNEYPIDLLKYKWQNPTAFQKHKISQSLNQIYNPSFLNYQTHH